MPARRLASPLHPGAARGRPVRFTVDGAHVEGFEGEPVAVALLATGRPVLSRSFRFHRPRGLMCSTGQCGWCECRIDGRPSVRSCRALVRDGMAVQGEHALPSVRRDLLALLDLGSPWVPPTFYHHRFLRPRRLRKRYLDFIRWFGGRGRLGSGGTGLVRRPIRRLDADVIVIGGGPAGLLAARAAAASGASVLVVETDTDLGGPWRWREEALAGGSSVAELQATLRADPRVSLLVDTTVVGIYHGRVRAVASDALVEMSARATVVATGSYERLPLVPGNERPGVMGARTVEWLVRAQGVVPGQTAAIVGDGPDARRAAAALRAAGSTVAAEVAEDVLVGIDGRSRVGGIRLRTGGRERRIAVDLVVVTARTPSIELTAAAGAAIMARSDGRLVPHTDADGRASDTLFVVGSAAGRPIEDPEAAARAADVGRTAASGPPWSAGMRGAHGEGPARGAEAVVTVRPSTIPAGAMVCFCEDVRSGEIARERAHGYADPELLKRRTGSLTGPCQGKYCAVGFCEALGAADPGTITLPTTRPPARPVRLGDLVAEEVPVVAPERAS